MKKSDCNHVLDLIDDYSGLDQSFKDEINAHCAVCNSCMAYFKVSDGIKTWADTQTCGPFHNAAPDKHTVIKRSIRFMPAAAAAVILAVFTAGLLYRSLNIPETRTVALSSSAITAVTIENTYDYDNSDLDYYAALSTD